MPKISNGALPDFLCIGAQKAGTTWLHSILKLHPELWLPQRKEIHYFDLRYPPYPSYPDQEYPTDTKDNAVIPFREKLKVRLTRLARYTPTRFLWEIRYRYFPRNDKWYERLFSPAQGRMTGDFTPGYLLLNNEAVAKVHGLLPSAKIIFIIREPIERSWSHAKMILGLHGYIPTADISHNKFIDFLKSEPSLRRGRYSEIIDRWRMFYPADSFFLLYFDDLSENPERLVSDTLKFLGLGPMTEQMRNVLHVAVHKGQNMDIPDTLYLKLFELYEPELRLLARRYGGIAQKWLSNASRRNQEARQRVNGKI